MKKFLNMCASFVLLAMVSSCSSYTEEFEDAPQMVKVSLDCTLDGTRANGNDLYSQLYNKVLSKELVADSYILTFTETTTGESFTLRGDWNSTDLVSIKTGRYKVVGSSTASGEGIQNKCSIRFDTEAVVSATSSKLNLKANYDCFLIIFDKKVINDAYILYGVNSSKVIERHFFDYNNIIYGFSRKLYNEENASSQYLYINYNDNSGVQLSTNKLNAKYGEYYVFNEYTTTNTALSLNWQAPSFTLDKMTYGKL